MGQLGQAPYPFAILVSFFWMGIFLITGTLLRAKVPFIRRNLIPACLSGGFLGALLFNLGVFDSFGPLKPDISVLSGIVFHMFALSFVCFGLAGFGNGAGSTPAKVLKGALWLVMTYNGIAYLQSCMSVGCIAAWNTMFGTHFLESAGILVNRGFAQGPGAGLAVAAVWEQVGHGGMISLAMSFAATGFLASLILGVPLVNWLSKKSGLQVSGRISEKELIGVYEPECGPSGGLLTFISSNIDTFSFQAALIFIVYGLAYLLCSLCGLFLSPKTMGMMWGMFPFLFCLPLGLFVSEVLIRRVLRIGHLHNGEMHARFTGFIIDFMAVGALLAVEIRALGDWLPLMIILSILAAVVTALYLYWACRHLTDYAPLRFAALLGNATGTITSGLVLLRMQDPEFRTPVSRELALNGIAGMLFMPISLFLIPLEFGQALGTGSSWGAVMLATGGLSLIFSLLIRLPFWGNQDKIAKY